MTHDVEEQEGEDLSYEEILANLMMNQELIITIPIEKETAVRNGLKNMKSKQNARMKAEGLAPDNSVLEFFSYPSKEYPECVDLRIELKNKAVIRVKKMVVPSNSFD